VFDAERRDLRCRTELVAFDPQVFDLLVYLVNPAVELPATMI